MKTIFAASAILLAIAAPASAQLSGATSANPNVSDRPSLWLNDQNPAPGYDQGIDYGTTRSIGSDDSDAATYDSQGTSSPMQEDSSENGQRAVGGRAN